MCAKIEVIFTILQAIAGCEMAENLTSVRWQWSDVLSWSKGCEFNGAKTLWHTGLEKKAQYC